MIRPHGARLVLFHASNRVGAMKTPTSTLPCMLAAAAATAPWPPQSPPTPQRSCPSSSRRSTSAGPCRHGLHGPHRGRHAPLRHPGAHHAGYHLGVAFTVRYTIGLGAPLRIEPRPGTTIAVYRGALLYALALPSNATAAAPADYSNKAQTAGFAPPQARDWTLQTQAAWNYAPIWAEGARACLGAAEVVVLRPYGSAKLQHGGPVDCEDE
ncbi:hypothetical protein P8C59_008330 [Phyllachora maydis]|uniref:Uncharacterized protein n=1 Tax=Phyllachora maydis TaxID=1825666 RepID=A0AAD9MEG8_9PEZI|nr:hypothetical protein P8C59_008330 [Phyllachora maydis]